MEKMLNKRTRFKLKISALRQMLKKIRRGAINQEKIVAKGTSETEYLYLSKIYKEPLKLDNKKTNKPILDIEPNKGHRPKETPHGRRHTDGK